MSPSRMPYSTLKVLNTGKPEFANTVKPDQTAHNAQSHLDLQCLSSILSLFEVIRFELKVLGNFAGVILWHFKG